MPLYPFSHRESQRKGAALVEFRLHGDIAFMSTYELVGNGQAQSGPCDPRQSLVFGPVDLPEIVDVYERNAQIERSSGNSFNDRAALRAIKSATPFERLPYQYNLTYLLIHFEFIWE